MAIRTTIQPRQIWRNAGFAVACLVFALWGWYDYQVKIPAKERAVAEHAALTGRKDALEAKRANGESLSAAEIDDYERVTLELAQRFKEAPVAPAAYDRAVQLWVYIVGCGILGTPFFIWPLITMRRVQYSLEDDGTLRFPEGECRIEEVRDIDMRRWMSKSIAVVTLPSGAKSILDDYKFKHLDLIVGAIASRLYPDEWTPEAKPVKKSTSESAADAALGAEAEASAGDAEESRPA